MEKVYPKHIYDLIRREIAVDYIRHELRKYLPSVRGEVWKTIDSDVSTWFENAPFLYPVRDFWNGFHGILMGFKLYNGLLKFITGENVVWTKEEIEIDSLVFGTLNPLASEVGIKTTKVSEIRNFYDQNTEVRKTHVDNVIKHFGMSEKRDDTRIIVTEKEEGLIVYDGNGRTFLALLDGKKVIPAYVGRFVDKQKRPRNFWLPTSVLMEIAGMAKRALEEKDDELYGAYIRVLKNMLSESESGKYEMANRVLPNNEVGQKIKLDLALQ